MEYSTQDCAGASTFLLGQLGGGITRRCRGARNFFFPILAVSIPPMRLKISPPHALSLEVASHRLLAWAVAGSFERGIQVGHASEMRVFKFEAGDIDNLLACLEALQTAR
ncbi:hypothetical protein [Aurantiacibacter flavus]|uniref:Uncharacterized protein n=1 Tax=Aurantiacibacter flavus TaxID=3145232 RepID=A0ABV0CVS8_9SPHN